MNAKPCKAYVVSHKTCNTLEYQHHYEREKKQKFVTRKTVA